MPTRRKYENQAERQTAYRERLVVRQAERTTERAADPPGHARWRRLLHTAYQTLHTVQVEIESYYEARSEAWRDSERGEALATRIESLGEPWTR